MRVGKVRGMSGSELLRMMGFNNKEEFRRWYERYYRKDIWGEGYKPDLKEGKDLGELQQQYLMECRAIEADPEGWEPPKGLTELFPEGMLRRMPVRVKRAMVHGRLRFELEQRQNKGRRRCEP